MLPALAEVDEKYPGVTAEYGYKCSYNPTFGARSAERSWISEGYYALDQGPVIAMLENFRSGLVWRLLRKLEPIRRGLRRAGFSGGWLDEKAERK